MARGKKRKTRTRAPIGRWENTQNPPKVIPLKGKSHWSKLMASLNSLSGIALPSNNRDAKVIILNGQGHVKTNRIIGFLDLKHIDLDTKFVQRMCFNSKVMIKDIFMQN